MKKTLITLLGLVCAATVFGQGTILFNNRVAGSFDARIFGQVPSQPTLQIQGQPAAGVPTGTTDYLGAPMLAGTGYTAQLFGGALGTTLDPYTTALALTGTLDFRTGTAAGILTTPAPTIVVNGVPEGSRATLQIRVWDNKGGTITSWAQVLQNQDTVAHGWSPAFDTLALGGVLGTPPALGAAGGLQSFNLFIVPEPSVIALGVLGIGALLLFRRRKN